MHVYKQCSNQWKVNDKVRDACVTGCLLDTCLSPWTRKFITKKNDCNICSIWLVCSHKPHFHVQSTIRIYNYSPKLLTKQRWYPSQSAMHKMPCLLIVCDGDMHQWLSQSKTFYWWLWLSRGLLFVKFKGKTNQLKEMLIFTILANFVYFPCISNRNLIIL